MSRYGDWLPTWEVETGNIVDWWHGPTRARFACDARGWISADINPPLTHDHRWSDNMITLTNTDAMEVDNFGGGEGWSRPDVVGWQPAPARMKQ